MTHMLLKNTISNFVGRSAYLLLTQSAAQRLEIPLNDTAPHSEHFDHYPPIETYVIKL